MYQHVLKCRICGNSELEPLLDLGVQHLTGVFPTGVDDEPPAVPLELVKCHETSDTCGLVQLKHSSDTGAMYGANYGYRSGLNRSMVEHLHQIAAKIKTVVSLRPGDTVLDLTDKRLRRGVFRDVEELIMAIGDYIDHHNRAPKPFIWTAKATDILEKVKRARKALDNRHSA